MGIRASHTADGPSSKMCGCRARACLAAKERLDERLARAREGKSSQPVRPLCYLPRQPSRSSVPAVGIARAAYEYALDYAKERKQFGRPSSRTRPLHSKAGGHETRIDASRLPSGGRVDGQAGPQVHCGRSSMEQAVRRRDPVWVTEQAIQILGGYGYVRENLSNAGTALQDLHDF